MDILYLLTRDISEHIINNINIATILNLATCSKTTPDLLYHRTTKELFIKEMRNMPIALLNNDKIVSYIYNHKIIMYDPVILQGKTYNRIAYRHDMIIGEDIYATQADIWTQKNIDIVSYIVSATINKNDSHLFYSIFIDGTPYIKCNIVYEYFVNHNMRELAETFLKKYICNHTSYYLACPWLTIPLMMNDKYWIERALTFYNASPYILYNCPLKNIHIICPPDPSIHTYIEKYYPEFVPLLTLINSKEPQEK